MGIKHPNNLIVMTSEQAKASGFTKLASPYKSHEQDMMSVVIEDITNTKKAAAIVKKCSNEGVYYEVWQRSMLGYDKKKTVTAK